MVVCVNNFSGKPYLFSKKVAAETRDSEERHGRQEDSTAGQRSLLRVSAEMVLGTFCRSSRQSILVTDSGNVEASFDDDESELECRSLVRCKRPCLLAAFTDLNAFQTDAKCVTGNVI